MSFKVGDRIKLIGPSDCSCDSIDIGKRGTIVALNDQDACGPYKNFVAIYLDNSHSIVHNRDDYKCHWNTDPSWLELLYKPGEQLLFDFMKDKDNEI